MKIKLLILFIQIFIIVSITACSNYKDDIQKESDNVIEAKYRRITANEAKKIIDNETDYIILDVRTQQEYDESHIENAILIPYTEILEQAETILTDKNQKILVYCRSGKRSQIATKQLISLGYTNVYDFGGIIDWPYETVK